MPEIYILVTYKDSISKGLLHYKSLISLEFYLTTRMCSCGLFFSVDVDVDWVAVVVMMMTIVSLEEGG